MSTEPTTPNTKQDAKNAHCSDSRELESGSIMANSPQLESANVQAKQDELYLLVYADDGTPAMGGGSSTKKQLRVYLTFEEALRGVKKIRNDDNRTIVIRRYVR